MRRPAVTLLRYFLWEVSRMRRWSVQTYNPPGYVFLGHLPPSLAKTTIADFAPGGRRHLLAVPRFRLNTYGRRAFSVAGPMA